MMQYRPEPPFAHDRMPRVGVLLVNLGTPDAPTPAAVRRYLGEFLTDPRVVEIPRARLAADPARRRAAHAAGEIRAQVRGDLDARMARRCRAQRASRRCCCRATSASGSRRWACRPIAAPSSSAMRYGNPPIARGARPPARGAAASASWSAAVSAIRRQHDRLRVRRRRGARRARAARARRCASSTRFHDDPATSRRWRKRVNDYWMKHGRPEHLRAVASTACRGARSTLRRPLPLPLPEDRAAARARARARATQWTICVPVALRPRPLARALHGRRAAELGAARLRRVDVFCPGFVADCLETLEEIGIEGKQTFAAAGGEDFDVIPCLNEHPAWIAALADLALRQPAGLARRRRPTPPSARRRRCARRRARRRR